MPFPIEVAGKSWSTYILDKFVCNVVCAISYYGSSWKLILY